MRIGRIPTTMFKGLFKLVASTIFFSGLLMGAQAALAQQVKITQELPAFKVKIGNKTHVIDRIQDTSNKLTNSFAKTSRKCPPFCIHPMKAAPGIETVGELELMDFLKRTVEPGSGLLIDARIAKFYEKGTIPGAVNIPFTLFSPDENPFIDKIRAVLGGVKSTDGRWNFDNALELMLFCNGPWCDQSPRALKNLISAGYPANKLFYYRGGMQNWQNLGLTVEVPTS